MTTTRGTTNRNARGSSYSRRARRQWLLETYGDGITCPCYRCGDLLGEQTVTVDRIVPGVYGGTYRRGNIRPACGPCNSETGGALRACPHDFGPELDECGRCGLPYGEWSQ